MRAPEEETLLSAYRKRNRLTLERLGELLGVTPQAVSRYCLPKSHKHHRRPGADAADRLRELTDGVVTVANYADPYKPGDLAGASPETCGAGS